MRRFFYMLQKYTKFLIWLTNDFTQCKIKIRLIQRRWWNEKNKIIFILLALILVLTSCGAPASSNSKDKEAEGNASEATGETTHNQIFH